MALERSNPLPPNGRFWVDVSPQDQPAFTAWLGAYRTGVKVITTKRDTNGWDWVLFQTTAPLVWWEGPGFPTIAPADVASESDVKQIPHVETSEELLSRIGSGAAELAGGATTKLAIGAVAILLAAVLVTRVMR